MQILCFLFFCMNDDMAGYCVMIITRSSQMLVPGFYGNNECRVILSSVLERLQGFTPFGFLRIGRVCDVRRRAYPADWMLWG